ncbi:MAG TPA: type IV pilus assembly protein PilM [Candidatus Saccharimonadales bacterium]
MSILSGVNNFFGLDIGTNAIRLVQLSGSGATKSLVKYAYVPLDTNIAISDSKNDQQKLMQVIKNLLEQAKLTTKNVAVGLPSQKVFTAVVDIDRLTEEELARSIYLQADSLIPTPIAESKLDWALLGDSPADKSKVEVLLTSVTNDYVEKRLDMLESIGLNVIAFEPDNLALARSLLAPNQPAAQMVLNVGAKSTDLVICMDGAPRLTRAIPTGVESIIRAATQNLNIDDNQAEHFIYKFGMTQDKLEGQVYQAILGTVDILVAEIEKSIKFFATRYAGVKLERIVVTGGASTIPSFPNYLANKFGIEIEIGNAWRGVAYSSDRQDELSAISNQFGVAVGLAERNE